jgi:hypothetical protein
MPIRSTSNAPSAETSANDEREQRSAAEPKRANAGPLKATELHRAEVVLSGTIRDQCGTLLFRAQLGTEFPSGSHLAME